MKLTQDSDHYYHVDDTGAFITWLERGYGYAREKKKRASDSACRLSAMRHKIVIHADGRVAVEGANPKRAIDLFEAVCAGEIEQLAFVLVTEVAA